MRNTKWKKMAAAVATGMLVASTMMTAMAAETTNIVKPATAEKKFTFDKVLTLEENVVVPDETFIFSIAPITDTEIKNAGTDTVRIEKGLDGATIQNPSFSSADIATENKVTKQVEVSFSSITFENPGIYRYVITETGNRDGMKYATNKAESATENKFYLDVYVLNNSNNTGFEYQYVLHKTDSNSTSLEDTEKIDKIENEYVTSNLTVTKEVTGNQGDRNKKFEFTITVYGDKAGEQYKVKVGDGFVAQNLQCAETAENEKYKATGKYEITHDQSIVIYGLSENDTYVVTETDYATEGYTTSWSRTGNGDNADSSDAGTHVITTETSTGVSTAIGTTDDAITFTNDKSVTTPTGIALTIAPYAVMVIVAAGLAFVFLRKKRTIEE